MSSNRWGFTVAVTAWIFGVGSLEAQVSRWTADEILRIGALDGPTALTVIGDLVPTPSGLLVGQGMERVVRVFDLDGTLTRVIGRSGKGPGEFERVSRVAYIDDQIVILDEQLGRITRLSPAGELHSTARLVPPRVSSESGSWLSPVYPAVSGRFVWIKGTLSDRTQLRVRPAVLTAADGTVLDSLPPRHLRDDAVQAEVLGIRQWVAKPFHNGTRFDVSERGGFYATADPTTTEVQIRLVDLRTLERYRTDVRLEPVEVPGWALDAFVDARRETVQSVRNLRKALEESGAVQLDKMIVLEDGKVWFSRPAFQGDTRTWFQVDPRTGAIATLELPIRMRISGGSGEDLWAAIYDDLLVQYIVRLRLRRH